MKIIYQGVTYDTEKSEIIGVYISPEDNTHPAYISATLYRATHGRYFMHGSGGLLTKFNGRERILPVSDETAEALFL